MGQYHRSARPDFFCRIKHQTTELSRLIAASVRCRQHERSQALSYNQCVEILRDAENAPLEDAKKKDVVIVILDAVYERPTRLHFGSGSISLGNQRVDREIQSAREERLQKLHRGLVFGFGRGGA